MKDLFYCCGIPFALAWLLHDSLATRFAMQVYIITYGAFFLDPFEFQKKYVGQKWFWPAMLRSGAVFHPVLLIGLWFLDSRHPMFVEGLGMMFFTAIIIGIAEMVLLGLAVERWKPDEVK